MFGSSAKISLRKLSNFNVKVPLAKIFFDTRNRAFIAFIILACTGSTSRLILYINSVLLHLKTKYTCPTTFAFISPLIPKVLREIMQFLNLIFASKKITLSEKKDSLTGRAPISLLTSPISF